MSLWTDTDMDGLDATAQAKRAITHTLRRIKEDPKVGYYLGVGTQAFSLLTEAAATLNGEPVEKVRRFFAPKKEGGEAS